MTYVCVHLRMRYAYVPYPPASDCTHTLVEEPVRLLLLGFAFNTEHSSWWPLRSIRDDAPAFQNIHCNLIKEGLIVL